MPEPVRTPLALRWLAGVTAAALLLVVVAVALFEIGLLRFNYPRRARYPVRGIDVSHHQGRIDWRTVRAAGIDFAYIKASEGADFRDVAFARNWEAAGRMGIARGAYHYFSFCRPGAGQAENFLAVVPVGDPQLPPAIDVELGGQCERPPDPRAVREELVVLVERLERAYGRPPILYVTGESYDAIVGRELVRCPIWIRNIFWKPSLGEGRSWLIWQFAHRGRVRGISRFVDLDVLDGTPVRLSGLVR